MPASTASPGEAYPVLVVMCTNRERALDPAVLRRAAATFHFGRPDAAQRRAVLVAALDGIGIDSRDDRQDRRADRPAGGRPGFTYSDLTQRLIPTAILAAFPGKPLTADILLDIAASSEANPRIPERPRDGRCRPSATGVRTGGDRFQWLVAWLACVTVLYDAATGAPNPVLTVGVEVDGAGNLDDVVIRRQRPPHTYQQVKYAVDNSTPISTDIPDPPSSTGGPTDPPQDRRRLARAHQCR